MPLPGSDKYRQTTPDPPRDGLVDRANEATSTLTMLLSLGCSIPEGVQRSWKFHCPWEEEHGDGGKDKAARYYGTTDTAFCFAGHGALTPVKMLAYDSGITYKKAAEKILRDTGQWNVTVDWRERFAELKDKKQAAVSITYAVDALRLALSEDEQYRYRQYDEDVRAKMEQALEVLDAIPDYSLENLRLWRNKSKAAILKVVHRAKEET